MARAHLRPSLDSNAMTTRRDFLSHLSRAAGAVVLVPIVSRVAHGQSLPTSGASPSTGAQAALPWTRPEGWDPVTYNRIRGNAGAIPSSYLPSINGEDGVENHLGKHLPYVPGVDAAMVPAGFVALMWGDPSKGHARHPNAVREESNGFEGHWYDWIRIRKATEDEAEELQSTYDEWPGLGSEATGAYAVFGGGDITADAGKNTIYLAALPSDVVPGDVVRVHAHCLTHGEYVDFVTV